MTTDEWLEKNTFYCASLSGRFTKEQCETNRERALGMEFPGLMKACISCGGQSTMANNKCIEPGCDKFRVTNQRSVKHSKEYQLKQPSASKAAGAAVEPPAATADVEPVAASRSLLFLVDPAPPHSVVTVDFSGNEDLLAWANTLSDDLSNDIISLLQHVKDGKLFRREAKGE